MVFQLVQMHLVNVDVFALVINKNFKKIEFYFNSIPEYLTRIWSVWISCQV